MKKLVWSLLALVLSVSVVGCDKRENVDALVKNKNIDSIQAATDVYATGETIVPNVIIDEKEIERKNKLFENTDFPKNFTNAVENYVFPFRFNFPSRVTSRHFGSLKDYLSLNESYENAYKTYEAAYINDFLEYNSGITITETDTVCKTINGLQEFTLPSGKKLEYDFQYKFDNKESIFSLAYYKLRNMENIIKPLSTTTNVDSMLSYMSQDPESQKKLELFSNYINDIIDIKNLGEFKLYSFSFLTSGQEYEHLNKKLEAKCYVKGNFTNSGKDEYLVAYNRGKTHGDYNSYEEYIEIMACLIVENNQVIQSYKFPRVVSIICEGWNNAYSKLGQSFSQGIVGDFNKNGINEILFYNKQVVMSDYTMFEFVDGHFKEYSIIADINNSTYDNDTGTFISVHDGHMPDDGGYPIDYYWVQTSIWNEKEKCYILISDELNIKEIQ